MTAAEPAQFGLRQIHPLAPSGRLSDGLRDPTGYAAWSVPGACMIAGAILTGALGTHRGIPALEPPPDAGRFSLRRLEGELRAALGNPSYRTLVMASLFASVGGAFTDVFGLYLNTCFWEFSSEQLAAFVPGIVLGVGVGVLAAPPISVRFAKRSAALFLATASVAIGPLPIFLRLARLTPPNGSPLLLAALVVHAAFMVTCGVAIGILIGSMISDTIDQDELVTGKRQEGVFSSAIAFSAKAATGVGTLLAGTALDLIAFPRPDPGAPHPEIAPDQARVLGWIVGPGLPGLWVCTLFFLSRYRLTRVEFAPVVAELERRAQAVS